MRRIIKVKQENINNAWELWNTDLNEIKDNSSDWQRWFVTLKIVNPLKIPIIEIGFPYTRRIPLNLLGLDENSRKCCLAHECGHVIKKHCVKKYSLSLIAALACVGFLITQLAFFLLIGVSPAKRAKRTLRTNSR